MSVKTRHIKQKALVLLGGGALGAYETGALIGLCEHFGDENKGKNEGRKTIMMIIIVLRNIRPAN